MHLSYVARLWCLGIAGFAVLATVLEFAIWWSMPLLLRACHASSARWRERLLLAASLAPQLCSCLLVASVFLPRYIQTEDNTSSEHVGLICIAAALALVIRTLYALVHVAFTLRRTHGWRRQGLPLDQSLGGIPAISFELAYPLLAVIGLWRPIIAVSNALLEHRNLSLAGLDVALDHEVSHAHHRDNLKLFLLSCLPFAGFHTASRPSLPRQWRCAAELAADEDAVNGDRGRALQLAEMLLAFASTAASPLGDANMALLGHNDMLSRRIEWLLSSEKLAPSRFPLTSTILFASAAAVLLGSALTLLHLAIPLYHPLAELMLHIG